ncbi:hypothetical protein GUJ93_ZPchr0001g33154 [Zizania palustris]|uniref:Leucyl-tRNA synthetase editing domain-containing protein n=1 Tax=Zizania palustris TaxID=103762 RepID=A0A8J5UZH9_ZIZPA|nr:hypothetical protein GUJ93_ZPchr0001g33154 [Zizania palustris]
MISVKRHLRGPGATPIESPAIHSSPIDLKGKAYEHCYLTIRLRYLVLAPEHTLLPSLTSEEQLVHVEEYRELAARKSELERTDLQKEKTGFFSGSYAKNLTTKEIIPI